MKSTLKPGQNLRLELVASEQNKPVRYHSQTKTIFNVIVLCCSSWYFGYSLVQLSCLPANVLESAYTVGISNSAVIGVLIGLMTIGCAVGVFVSSFLVDFISRKNFILLVNILGLITCGVIQITHIEALGVCRIFQGVVAGCYLKVIPLYIEQITPHQIGYLFSHWPQIFVVLGVDIAYILQLIFTGAEVGLEPYWRVIFIIPAFIIIIQSILLIFLPNSPIQLINQNKLDEAKKIYAQFYKAQYINEVMQQTIKKLFIKKINDMNVWEFKIVKSTMSKLLNLKQPLIMELKKNNGNNQLQQPYIQIPQSPKNSSIQPDIQQVNAGNSYNFDRLKTNYTSASILLGFILAQSLHMSGILAVVTQAGAVQAKFSADIGIITPVTITSVQLLMTMFSIFIIKGMGIYLNIFFGLFFMGILHCVNGIFFIFIEWKPAISLTFAMLNVIMIVFASTIGNSIGMALGQLMPARLIPYAMALSWLGATFCIILLPIVMDAMNQNCYPAVFFMGGWSIGSALLSLYFLLKLKKLY